MWRSLKKWGKYLVGITRSITFAPRLEKRQADIAQLVERLIRNE